MLVVLQAKFQAISEAVIQALSIKVVSFNLESLLIRSPKDMILGIRTSSVTNQKRYQQLLN